MPMGGKVLTLSLLLLLLFIYYYYFLSKFIIISFYWLVKQCSR